MNDWLDYKGSGSIRSNNTMEHAYRPSNVPTTSGAYESINKELDALYTEMQTQLARQKKFAADLNSFVNAARRCKASSVLSLNGNRLVNNKWSSINSKIDSFSGSSLQKTALRNKLDSMTNKINSAIPKMDHLATDISIDTFNAMIDELNNNSSTNHH